MHVRVMKMSTTESTIQALRSVFGPHRLPEVLVSDNRTQFASVDFVTFLKT